MRPLFNDAERRMWVENDEALYLAWKRSGIGLYRWVRLHRQMIDAVISAALGGR